MNRFFTFLVIGLVAVACRKESFTNSPDARLLLSEDTLHFDTVFTNTGSVTYFFKITNPNEQRLRIGKISLGGDTSSPFKINADGFTGPVVTDLEIMPNDSLYVFVTVMVDPVSGNLPFVVRDSVQVEYNGNTQVVQLEAFGQNANFLRQHRVAGQETWTSELPYVILGNLHVAPNAILTIEKGSRIFVHADAPLIIDGTLQVMGEKDSADRVYFRSDRLDEPYRDFPAGWPGIYFRETSSNNHLQYAVIKNAYQAIALNGPSVNANPKVHLEQCIIDNAYDAGIIAINSSLEAVNTLVSNCGKNILLAQGGKYFFNHCTVASFSNNYLQHKDPVLYVSNFTNNNNIITSNDLQAQFDNCIFYGDFGLVDDEVVVAQNGNTIFDVHFSHSLMKVKNQPSLATLTQVIYDDPQFEQISTADRFYDFRLKGTSPALNAGKASPVMMDLDGLPRPVGIPDLGAFEKQ